MSSPRRRHRLAWAAVVLLAATAGGMIALLYPNTGEKEVFRPGKPKITHVEPPSTPLPKRDLATAQRTLSRFVINAVLRQHVERSYDLVAPSIHAGLTRKEWRSGDIPVPPFPAKALALAKSKLVHSQPNLARYEVLLYTKPSAQLLPLLYSVELIRNGRRGRWLVDYAMPIGGGVSTRPTPYKAASQQLPDETGHGRLSLSWVFVPLGILSLIVFIPLTLAAHGWLENRRAEREYPRKVPPPLGPPGS